MNFAKVLLLLIPTVMPMMQIYLHFTDPDSKHIHDDGWLTVASVIVLVFYGVLLLHMNYTNHLLFS